MHKNHEIRYAWHPKTFECMGAVPSLIGEGVSPPDNTTALRPSIPEGCAAVWDAAASKWTYPEDHRGEQGWLCGASAIVKELGPLPAEWSTEPPPPPPDTRTAEEKRQAAYKAEADPIRQRIDGYRIEAEAWRASGENEEAIQCDEKAVALLKEFLAMKQEIRERYPDAGE